MEQLKQLAQQYAKEFRTIDSSSEYVDNMVFLKLLEQEYVAKEYYEIASLINSRIEILKSRNETKQAVDNFKGKLQSYKQISASLIK